MNDVDDKSCPVAGCHRHRRGVPMCRHHWIALASPTRRHLIELDETDPVACGVAVLLAAEEISEESPAWASGWSKSNAKRVRRKERRAQMAASQRQTCLRVRELSRGRYREDYRERTREWREMLGRIVPLVGGKRSALDVALAMVRGGIGTEGFCPLLVSAALDLDDSGGNELGTYEPGFELAGARALAGA
jgi:hypothetical protein